MAILVATPPLIVDEPSDVVPLKNWTVPVGITVPEFTPMTVAVSVVDWPTSDGLGDTVSDVVEASWAIVTVTVGDVAVENVPSLA